MNNSNKTWTKIEKTDKISSRVCLHCGAFSTGRCGCADARKARGETPAPVVGAVVVF